MHGSLLFESPNNAGVYGTGSCFIDLLMRIMEHYIVSRQLAIRVDGSVQMYALRDKKAEKKEGDERNRAQLKNGREKNIFRSLEEEGDTEKLCCLDHPLVCPPCMHTPRRL